MTPLKFFLVLPNSQGNWRVQWDTVCENSLYMANAEPMLLSSCVLTGLRPVLLDCCRQVHHLSVKAPSKVSPSSSCSCRADTRSEHEGQVEFLSPDPIQENRGSCPRFSSAVPNSLLMMALLESNNLIVCLRKLRFYILLNRHCAAFSTCSLISFSQIPYQVALVIIPVISMGI